MTDIQFKPNARRKNLAIEWPTLLLIVFCYASFFIITWHAAFLGPWFSLILLSVILVIHSSLQHEALHGHPFRNTAVNDALLSPAIGLFVPYLRFKETHLQHHYDPNLTDPYDDPETNFLDAVKWHRTPAWLQYIYRFNNTLLGRMVVGPTIGLVAFYAADYSKMRAGDKSILRAYGLHILSFIPIAIWLIWVSTLPLWSYGLGAYFCISILKIRTYLEHQSHERVASRSVIIEKGGILGFLFLNNHLHSVHHAFPSIAWYKLPAFYRARRSEFDRRNGGYKFQSYKQIIKTYIFRCKDPVAHPFLPLKKENIKG